MLGKTCDTLVHQHPTHAKHIIVICRGLLFKLDVLDSNNQRVSIEEIEKGLLSVGRISLEMIVTGKKVDQVGVLTAGHRDTWFKGTPPFFDPLFNYL